MARAAAKRAEEPQIEGEETDDTQALDETGGEEQSLRTGQINEVEATAGRALAKRMGWADKPEWKRDPAKWRDWDAYLEQTPRELDALKERNRRTAQAAQDAIEEGQRRARTEAEAAVRAAAEAQDPEAAVAASRELAKASGPPPQTVAWIGRNPWFNEDPDAQALAVAEITRMASSGATIEAQLEAAETKIRKRFPEHFGQAEPREERTEVRLSETRQAPAVQQPRRGGDIRPKEKAFGDIPPGDRALYAKHFARTYVGAGLTPEEAQARYAARYWANKDDAA